MPYPGDWFPAPSTGADGNGLSQGPASGLGGVYDRLLQLAATTGGRQTPQGQAPSAPQGPAPAPQPTSALEHFFGPAGPDQPTNALDPMGLTGYLGAPAHPSWYMDPNQKTDRGFIEFFNKNYPLAVKALAPYNVDPALAIAVVGFESGWGTSKLATGNNNPFNQKRLNGSWANYDSLEDGWQAWAKNWGPRVQDLGGDAQTFVHNLALDNRNVHGSTIGGDTHGSYTKDRRWSENALENIETVRRRLPRWDGNLDSLP